jgi:hypothetical protein
MSDLRHMHKFLPSRKERCKRIIGAEICGLDEHAIVHTRMIDPLENDGSHWGPPEQDAPVGTVWVCGACGKQASNRYDGGISYGWDESCMLNAVLCKAKLSVDTDPWEAVDAATT